MMEHEREVMMTTSMQWPLDTGPTIRPMRLLAVSARLQVPAPLVRVMTCGLLTLEILQEIVSADPPQARYAVLTPDRLRGRGVGPALSLLKLLVSRPQRFSPADWLLEQFCRGESEVFSTKRLDTLAWLLRDLLCPPGYESLRRQIVAHTRAMSGGGYQLAGYPLIWVDHEALCWNVEQAVRMERFGDDPLPFWQRAYELAKRGDYLPDEAYSEWAEARREEIAGLRRQSVLALARLFTEREGRAGEEQALVLLRSYWTAHPRDEDILRPLMELLGRRECYQEALDSYAKLCRVLEEDGQQPDPHTQDVVEYLRAKHIQRREQVLPALAEHRHDILKRQQVSESQSIDDSAESDEDMNRRQASKKIGFLIGSTLLFSPRDLLTPQPWTAFSTALEEGFDLENLTAFQKLTEASWHLLKASELDVLEQVQSSYLPRLAELAQQKSRYQKEAAGLLS